MKRALLWFLPAGTGLLAGILFSAGVGVALTGRLGTPIGDAPVVPPATSVPAVPAGDLLVVALGDSLTRGAGDVASKGGYPGRVVEALSGRGRTISIENLAVDGAVSEELARRIASPEVRARLGRASLVVLSIGGNDLTHAMPQGAGDNLAERAEKALAGLRTNVAAILDAVRKENPSAPIRLVGLYNPFPAEGPLRPLMRRQLLLWNVALEEAAAAREGVVVVPIADVFEDRPDRLSADRFHPAAAGYDEIAARVFASLPASLAGNASARAAAAR